jgi:hypothetical protein
MSQYQLAVPYGSVAAPAAGAVAPYSGLYTDPSVVPNGAQGMVVNHGGLVSNYGGNVQNIQVSQSEAALSTSWHTHVLAERHRSVAAAVLVSCRPLLTARLLSFRARCRTSGDNVKTTWARLQTRRVWSTTRLNIFLFQRVCA